MIPVVNVSTPVFDATGERRGVVLLSLNWDYLTDALRQAMLLDQNANTLLVDAQGRWLLDKGIESVDTASFGGNFAALSPHYWQAMQLRNEGSVTVDWQVLFLATTPTTRGNWVSRSPALPGSHCLKKRPLPSGFCC